MNKYEEALNNVKCAPAFMGSNPRYFSYTDSTGPFLDDIEILREAISKAEEYEEVKANFDNLFKIYHDVAEKYFEALKCIDELKYITKEINDILSILTKVETTDSVYKYRYKTINDASVAITKEQYEKIKMTLEWLEE